jgi:hypothetical protein
VVLHHYLGDVLAHELIVFVSVLSSGFVLCGRGSTAH